MKKIHKQSEDYAYKETKEGLKRGKKIKESKTKIMKNLTI